MRDRARGYAQARSSLFRSMTLWNWRFRSFLFRRRNSDLFVSEVERDLELADEVHADHGKRSIELLAAFRREIGDTCLLPLRFADTQLWQLDHRHLALHCSLTRDRVRRHWLDFQRF